MNKRNLMISAIMSIIVAQPIHAGKKIIINLEDAFSSMHEQMHNAFEELNTMFQNIPSIEISSQKSFDKDSRPSKSLKMINISISL